MNLRKEHKLAAKLASFKSTRIVCRFCDHPLVRELYPQGLWSDRKWQWQSFAGRKQPNELVPEVLLIFNGAA